MNTTAYLTRQGWRGDGHALHPNGYGIKKPLMVSKRTERLGVGKKAHDTHADQWWARAFDETLRSLNCEQSIGKKNASGAVPLQTSMSAAKWNGNCGLYDNFVRGEGLDGTITPTKKETKKREVTNHGVDVSRPSKKKRLNGSAKEKIMDDKIPSGEFLSQTNVKSEAGKAYVKANQAIPQREAISDRTSPLPLAPERTIAKQETVAGRKDLHSKGASDLDNPPSYSGAGSREAIRQGDCGGVRSNAALLETIVSTFEKKPQSNDGEHRVKMKNRGSKKKALTAGN
ncbi:MAG: hypothetical protein Q9170_005456 [Blastenia crenularia]